MRKSPESPTPPLPRRIRFAAAVCLVLSALSGFMALQQAVELSHLGELRDNASDTSRFSKDPDLVRGAHLSESYFAVLEPMSGPHAVVLGALSVACSFVFVSAARLLRPGGLPLERMRRVLAGSTLLAALLRTIDGAQWAVVGKRLGPILAKNLDTLPLTQGAQATAEATAQFKAMLPGMLSGFAMVMTAIVAGTFALLGQYFRSEAVRAAITAQDGELAVEEED
ncbi:hypothetical protein NR798_15730 [Archangium gephyra]|uniref:hypothetical protein n=1 Tax=Archangium gephyra TaxID=48 RepID=UPI0035D43484